MTATAPVLAELVRRAGPSAELVRRLDELARVPGPRRCRSCRRLLALGFRLVLCSTCRRPSPW